MSHWQTQGQLVVEGHWPEREQIEKLTVCLYLLTLSQKQKMFSASFTIANLQVRPLIMCNFLFPSSLIQEFKFMGQCRSPSVSPSRQAASSTGPAQEQLSLFQQYLQEGNPFEMPAEHREEETEDVLASNGVRDRKHASGWLLLKKLVLYWC